MLRSRIHSGGDRSVQDRRGVLLEVQAHARKRDECVYHSLLHQFVIKPVRLVVDALVHAAREQAIEGTRGTVPEEHGYEA